MVPIVTTIKGIINQYQIQYFLNTHYDVTSYAKNDLSLT